MNNVKYVFPKNQFTKSNSYLQNQTLIYKIKLLSSNAQCCKVCRIFGLTE